jgi:hypothetical protein
MPFDNFFVVDLKIHYDATKNFAFDFGIDNLFNEQIFCSTRSRDELSFSPASTRSDAWDNLYGDKRRQERQST